MYTKVYKIIIAGTSGTSKSFILIRYVNEQYCVSLLATVSPDIKFRHVCHADRDIRLNLKDSAGQEVYRSLTRSFIIKMQMD